MVWQAPRFAVRRTRRDHRLVRAVRVLTLAPLLCAALLATGARIASAHGSGYFVTFVARSCPAYSDIFANRARNDILESLKDLGPNTQYGDSGQLVNPNAEGIPPQDRCVPLPSWEFTLGTGYRTRAVTGPWGSLSVVTKPFARAPIVTQRQTPLLDQDGVRVDSQQLAGATTIELTPHERAQAGSRNQLWVQGGRPSDPVLTQRFPGPRYGFGALRCATDNLNGDNVEYVFFPTGVRHVFCYGLYVTPPPTAGIITIRKQVTGAPAGDDPSFPYTGSISYTPGGFQLRSGGSKDFYRAGGSTWTVTEGAVADYRPAGISCQAKTPAGGPGRSTVTVTGSTASIHLVAEEHVTCTYLNSYVPPPGGLTIRKLTRGGVGQFSYVVTPVSGTGSTHRVTATTVAPGVAADAIPSLDTLPPGRYVIREREPSSPDGQWRSRQIRCNGVTETAGPPVQVDVPSGSSVTCTFVNSFVPRGSISLAKVTVGATGTAAFLIAPLSGLESEYRQTATTTAPGAAFPSVPDTPADTTDHLRLGAYRITEQAPAGSPAGDWSLTAVECNGELTPFSQELVRVALTRAQPSAHCVFTNSFSPTPPPPPTPIDPPPIVPPVNPDNPDNPARPEYQLSDLVVTKHASVASVIRGAVVSYTIAVANLGPDPAESVMLDDQPLGSVRVVSVHPSAGTCRSRLPVVCSLGTLNKGAKVTVTLRLQVLTTARTLVNRAVAGTATQEQSMAGNVASALVRVLAPAPPSPPSPPRPVGGSGGLG